MTICLAESARRGLLIALLVLSYGVRVGADAFDCPPLSRGDYLAPPVSKFGRGLVWACYRSERVPAASSWARCMSPTRALMQCSM